MYEVVKAINKFAEEIDVELHTGRELTKLFAEALFADARENNELLDEFPDNEDENETSSIGTVYVDVKPNFDKIKEAFTRLSED